MHLSMQNWMTPAAKRIMRVIADAGGEARFVGGCVRDALLERPVTDVDMACTLPPERGMAVLEGEGIRVFSTGLAHGTITALCDGQTFEMTTLRRDVSTDGRWAEVAFTDNWREDAARRDFTMNALYADARGELYDYFGGIEDAKAGRVRFIGEAGQRIAEDGLRILRFFRFYAHYGTPPIDPVGLAACAEHAPMLEQLSGERIQTEMLKLLAAPQADEVLGTMRQQGILAHIALPEPNMALLRGMSCADPVLRLAALLYGQKEEAIEQVLQRWRLPNAVKARLRSVTKANMRVMLQWDEWEQKKAIRQWGKDVFCDRVRLAIAAYPDHAQPLGKMLELAERWQVPSFPVTGENLLAAGVPQGKALGEWLRKLESIWEEAHYTPDKKALLHNLAKLRADSFPDA